MALHHEHAFEEDICEHLATHGWLYAEPSTEGDARSYDTPRALYPADVTAWLQATQPQAWETLGVNSKAQLAAVALVSLGLYGAFLFVQTVRHPEGEDVGRQFTFINLIPELEIFLGIVYVPVEFIHDI